MSYHNLMFVNLRIFIRLRVFGTLVDTNTKCLKNLKEVTEYQFIHIKCNG